MREIKFRAWDADRKVWMNEKDVYDEVQEQARWNPERGERFKLMQYTGIKDKDGREIYEGDVLRHKKVTLVVIPMLGGLSIIDIIYYGEDHNELIAYPVNDAQTYSFIKQTKIIGNIHDNPELLNDR